MGTNSTTTMKISRLFILCILFLITPNTSAAGKLYKWVDENDRVSFSDKIRPKDSHRKREVLDANGRIIEIQDAAKTPKQIKQLKEITTLQKTQRRLLKNHIEKDAALLQTFQSETDVDTLAKSRFEMISTHIALAMGQIEVSKKQIIRHQKAAANFERLGKKIPEKTIANLTSAQAQLKKSQQEIINYQIQEKEVTKQLFNDQARLKTLELLNGKTADIYSDTNPHLSLGKLLCRPDNCQPLWAKANAFITKKGSETTFTSKDLTLTKKPILSKDRGLSLTKINDGASIYIVLDIRCAASHGGKTTCRSKETMQLVKLFSQLAR